MLSTKHNIITVNGLVVKILREYVKTKNINIYSTYVLHLILP